MELQLWRSRSGFESGFAPFFGGIRNNNRSSLNLDFREQEKRITQFIRSMCIDVLLPTRSFLTSFFFNFVRHEVSFSLRLLLVFPPREVCVLISAGRSQFSFVCLMHFSIQFETSNSSFFFVLVSCFYFCFWIENKPDDRRSVFSG